MAEIQLNKPIKRLLVRYIFREDVDKLEMLVRDALKTSSDMFQEMKDFAISRGFEVRDPAEHPYFSLQIIHPDFRADGSVVLKINFQVKEDENYYNAVFQSINGEPFKGFYKQKYES